MEVSNGTIIANPHADELWEDETTQFHSSHTHGAAGANAGGVQEEQTKSSVAHESRILKLSVVVDDGSDSISCSSSSGNASSLQTWGLSAKSHLSSVYPNYHFTNLSVVEADDDDVSTGLTSEGDNSSVPSSSCLSKTISLSVHPTNSYGASSDSGTDFSVQSPHSQGLPSLSDDLTTRNCLMGGWQN